MRDPFQDGVLVTGVSGFLGSHLCRLLLTEGYKVRGSVRDLSKGGALRSVLVASGAPVSGLDLVEADLRVPDDWHKAVEGCSSVMHLASPFPLYPPKNPDEVILPAVEGTVNVLSAAKAAGISQVVMTSSIAAVCYDSPDRPGHIFTEDDWTNPDAQGLSAYIQSKAIAEKEAWRIAEHLGLDLAVIAPGVILGPLILPEGAASVELVRKLLNDNLPGCPRFGWPIADVRDVAKAHVDAMKLGPEAPRRFLVASRFMWTVEIARHLREQLGECGNRVPGRQLPDWLVRLYAIFDREVASVLFELGQRREVSTIAAEQWLGWSPRPVEETLIDCARSLIDHEV
ncbi:MAG: NAD-dependent epimerase/dehydratase family protein [Rhodospirillales bacterium]